VERAVMNVVGLQIEVRELAQRIVILRKEASSAKYDEVQPVLKEMQAAKSFGCKLCDAVDVSGGERSKAFIEPDSSRATLPRDVLRDHERCRRGEDKAVVARRDRSFKQVQGAGHIGFDKGRPGIARNIRLVHCRG